MATLYPKEIFASIRENRSLAIMANFTRATIANEDIPLAVYDKKFSRLTFTGIDSEHQCSVSANIPVSLVAGMLAASDYAYRLHMDALYTKKEEAPESPAYTVRIASGTLKGRTPAEVLLEEANGKDLLNSQYKWLAENAAKYPKNKVQMEAIAEAAKLFKDGKLNKDSVQHSQVVNLYNADVRPLLRKPREDGTCPVYGISIDWHIGEKTPVVVTVKSFYAPVIQDEKGRINVQVTKMDKTTYTQVIKNLDTNEWCNAVRCIETAMLQFEVANARACIDDAEGAAMAAAQNYKKENA
jgi:hypothetical protein